VASGPIVERDTRAIGVSAEVNEQALPSFRPRAGAEMAPKAQSGQVSTLDSGKSDKRPHCYFCNFSVLATGAHWAERLSFDSSDPANYSYCW
jgi:hypothetical protein